MKKTEGAARRVWLLGVFVVSGLVVGCNPLPSELPERGLYTDLRRAVEIEESVDWVSDRLEVEDMAEDQMRSACQVDAGRRSNLRRWIEGRIAAEGGPAEEQFRSNGGDVSAISEALRLERIRDLLDHVDRLAMTDCPFWLPPDEEFAGVQGDEGRIVLFAETIGGVGLSFSGDEFAATGSAGGRGLIGWGFSSELTVATGLELAGAGTLDNPLDPAVDAVEFQFSGAVPFLFRIGNSSRFIDLEVAISTRWGSNGLRLPGVRALVAYGLTTTRVAGFAPYFALFLSYEFLPTDGMESALHVISIGTRAGLNWDP